MKKLILFAGMLFTMFASHAENLYIQLTNGTSYVADMSEVASISFPEEGPVVTLTNGAVRNFTYSEFVAFNTSGEGAVIPTTKPGDFDGNGKADVNDLKILINAVCFIYSTESHFDLNGDGYVTTSDIVWMIDIVMGRL